MSLVLAALSLFGLGIFGPGIASGLVSGAPQLGAGAAIGTAGAVAGAAMLTGGAAIAGMRGLGAAGSRSEEHTSELQSLMRISYAVFCLKKKKTETTQTK